MNSQFIKTEYILLVIVVVILIVLMVSRGPYVHNLTAVAAPAATLSGSGALAAMTKPYLLSWTSPANAICSIKNTGTGDAVPFIVGGIKSNGTSWTGLVLLSDNEVYNLQVQCTQYGSIASVSVPEIDNT